MVLPTGSCPLVVVRTYTVTDLCNNISASLQQTINIDDNTAPSFTGHSRRSLSKAVIFDELPAAFDVAGLITAGASISDNCTPNDQLTVQYTDAPPTGSCPVVVVRTYTVTDLCLNVSATLQQTINIDDNTAPSLTGTLGSINVEGCDIDDLPAALDIDGLIAAGAVISDNCTPDDQLTVQLTDALPTGSCPVTVIRTYTVTDLCLNVSTPLLRQSL